MLYTKLYQPACLRALKDTDGSLTAAQEHSRCIETNLVSMFTSLESEDTTAKDIHTSNLRRYSDVLKSFRSNRTCLYCIRRPPEHSLACGHSICNVCTRIFGVPSMETDFQYIIRLCLICGPKTTVIALKPPTSGVRILTVDGGGIRGVVPLEFLGIIQGLLGSGCAIQDMFDLAFGTSSGM